MRRLNFRFLLILVLSIAIGGALIEGVHAVQVRRQSNAFLREADRAEEAGKRQETIDLLRKYLLLSPDDGQAMARLGNLLFDQRRYFESQLVLSQIIQRNASPNTKKPGIIPGPGHFSKDCRLYYVLTIIAYPYLVVLG